MPIKHRLYQRGESQREAAYNVTGNARSPIKGNRATKLCTLPAVADDFVNAPSREAKKLPQITERATELKKGYSRRAPQQTHTCYDICQPAAFTLLPTSRVITTPGAAEDISQLQVYLQSTKGEEAGNALNLCYTGSSSYYVYT
ncbi:hypothetical protein Moror_4240 [Moniliophthora roreri MCA 2997]|uniref:Uncharacterized protein n=1 Tax=Moniliophthora roreri (strain MCA 2997) TaxID=1381753 RepID=V2YFZ3_MONRO|nr:hypothetical protein Moror_4240 [Moniliophthora roreri MCA 2997]